MASLDIELRPVDTRATPLVQPPAVAPPCASRSALFAAVVLAALSGRAVARAHEPVSTPRGLPALFGDAARERLADPAILGRITEDLAPGRLARLLEDLHLELRTFERASDDSLALGFAYDMAKSLRTLEGASEDAGASLDFVASGHVALDSDANPDDFLATALRLRWSGTRSFGPPGETRAERVERLSDPDVTALAELDPRRFAELAARFEGDASSASCRRS